MLAAFSSPRLSAPASRQPCRGLLPLLVAGVLSLWAAASAPAQTLLLDLSTSTTFGSLNGAGSGPNVPATSTVSVSRPFSATTPLSPSGVPVFYGGYSITYANSLDVSYFGNTVQTVSTSSGINRSGDYLSLLASQIGFSNPTAGVSDTNITGFVYTPGIVAAGSDLFARVIGGNIDAGATGVGGRYSLAVHLGGVWYVSLSDALNYSRILTDTNVTASWSGTFQVFDPNTYSLTGGQTLPAGNADAVGLYFTDSATLHTSSGNGAEIRFDQIGYSAIPEPGATAAALGGLSLAIAWTLRRRTQRAAA